MDLQLVACAAVLFASMLVPLPAPAGLALTLWALAAGVPLPVVLALYISQDVVTYAVLSRIAPLLHDRVSTAVSSSAARLPRYLMRPLSAAIRPSAVGGVGLLSASLISFYAGTMLATLRSAAPLRSAAIVIGVDVAKYLNGLAVALGAAHLLPVSMWSTIAASALGIAAALALHLIASRLRPNPALQAARVS